ncbi:hypothetical protein [Thiothrix eikelboomii]|uniref:hypothetical protein n=1 Tax=Thiothrix eikelboomii TaxID=92487 RepID=UPI003BB0DB25
MAINQNLKSSTQLKSRVNMSSPDLVIESTRSNADEINSSLDLAEAWGVIRWVLVAWAIGIWLLLVMLPGMDKIINATTAMLHLPTIFIGLGLIGAILAAYNMRSDKHLLWFLAVLLLLAGWM